MTCHCASTAEHQARADQASAYDSRLVEERAAKERAARIQELRDRTPDPDNYEIIEVCRVGPHLILKVKYASCVKCSFEGTKIMVYLNTPEVEVLRWKRIDPHFTDPDDGDIPRGHAPGPNARFPANMAGWEDARAYAQYRDRDHTSLR
jgi:hypothetical protein